MSTFAGFNFDDSNSQKSKSSKTERFLPAYEEFVISMKRMWWRKIVSGIWSESLVAIFQSSRTLSMISIVVFCLWKSSWVSYFTCSCSNGLDFW